jgi:hypothetical protein
MLIFILIFYFIGVVVQFCMLLLSCGPQAFQFLLPDAQVSFLLNQ